MSSATTTVPISNPLLVVSRTARKGVMSATSATVNVSASGSPLATCRASPGLVSNSTVASQSSGMG